MTSIDKPYKGEIWRVQKHEFSEDQKQKLNEMYGPNLGFIFYCDFLNHPVFRGLDGFGGHTSLVVKYDEETGEVETLNSRYKVVK